MNENQLQLLLDLQLRQTVALEKIASALGKLVPEKAPNYQFPLESFRRFDWASIEATVIKSDNCGPAIVSWSGKQFVRRSPSNKFGAAIWYSRCIGKEGDRNLYEKLVTFKPTSSIEVDQVSQKAQQYF